MLTRKVVVKAGDTIELLKPCGGVPARERGFVLDVGGDGTPIAKFALALLRIEVPPGVFFVVEKEETN